MQESFWAQRLKQLYQEVTRLIKPACVPLLASVALISVPGISQEPVDHSVEPLRITGSTTDESARYIGQTVKINLNVKGVTRVEALRRIAQQAGIAISWSEAQDLLSGKVSLSVKDADIKDAIARVVNGSGTIARYSSNGQKVVIVRDSSGQIKGENKGVVSGRITDSSSGSAIIGATVVVVGTTLSTVANEKGEFQIRGVPLGSRTISIKALGYQTVGRSVEVVEARGVAMIVRMVVSATALNEVVTTATGAQRRVEIPSDIVKIDADEIKERTPVRSVTDMLEAAQVPGVLVTRASGEPGAPTRIRMRGIGSISQSNDPVILVDGIWINNSSNSSGTRGIDDIDPETIETIEIVRGPSAATMYGMDAANGVIVITTKKGQAGTTRWNLGYSYDWGSIYGKKPLRYIGVGRIPDAAFPSALYCPAAPRGSGTESVAQGTCIQDSVSIYDPNHPLLSNEGVERNHRMTFSVDGGSEAMRYAITFSSQDQLGARRQSPVNVLRMQKLGIVPDKDFLQPSFMGNRGITTNFSLSPRSNLDVQVVVAGNQRNVRSNQYNFDFRTPDLSEVRDLSLDTILFIESSDVVALQTNSISPRSNGSRSSTIRLSSTSQWVPLIGTVFHGNIGMDRGLNDNGEYDYTIRCARRLDFDCRDTLGFRSEGRTESNGYSVRLSGSTVINLRGLNRFVELRPSIGGDYRSTQNKSLTLRNSNLPPGESGMVGGGGTDVQTSGEYNSYNNASAGWYLNTTIQMFRRLYFDVGVRQDIGSAIKTTSGAGGLPFGLPKLGSSWLVSDEPFWPHNNIVNLFRLRGAIGYAAVQPEINDIRGRYLSRPVYADNGEFVRSVVLSQAPNASLVPEKSGEIEVGFDSDLLYEKLHIVATYAHKENRNTIVTRSIAPSAGLGGSSSRKENIARVVNKNFELTATGRVIESDRFLFVGNYGLTLSDNRVAALGNNVTQGGSVNRIAVGYPLAGQWSPVVLGFRDDNGDGVLSASEIVLSDSLVYRGWSQPRHRSSFGGTLTINRQFTLDARFSYQSNYAQSYRLEGLQGREDATAPLIVQAMYAARAAGRSSGMNGTRSVSDLRWNSASITYHVPPTIVSKFRSRSLQISLQASNLALWTNYVGRDPGVNSGLLSDVPLEVSMDDGNQLPRPRLYVMRFQWGI